MTIGEFNRVHRRIALRFEFVGKGFVELSVGLRFDAVELSHGIHQPVEAFLRSDEGFVAEIERGTVIELAK